MSTADTVTQIGPDVGSRSCGVVSSADDSAWFDQLAATVEEIGRLST
jgi:hypothetical protein